ncbi:hypothetical protein [Armatimonas rosea]|uniref:Uncharacterized protein n=1 Tax=Armatimonas rosea TaxID=685828 RepID=A0A7W9WA65_ARMRO|nr:hypothetical protein [Armatimonas rosea]MBB6053970.1 hypothetical protein [Armatimonas rosea]
MPEIEQETVMGRREQDTARKKLRDLGLLEEKRMGQPAKLWFRLNRKAVVELLRKDVRERREQMSLQDSLQSDLQFGAFRQTRLAESAKLDCTNAPNKIGGKRQTIKDTKNTAKSTTKNTATTTRRELESEGLFAAVISEEREGKALNSNPIEPPDEALVTRLVEAGVGKLVAQKLASERPEECKQQLDYLPFAENIKSTKGAYLRTAIEQGFSPPKRWQEDQEHQRQEASKQARKLEAQRQGELEAKRKAELEEQRNKVRTQDPERWAELTSQAEALLPALVRSKPQSAMYQASLQTKINELLTART